MSVKCLCKIGVLITNQEIDSNNYKKIRHKNKIYESIIDCDLENIHLDISKHRDFRLLELKCDDDTEYLTISHDSCRQAGLQVHTRVRILSIVFPDFQYAGLHCDDDEPGEETKETKIDYVTTKLYDLLRTAHLTNGSDDSDRVIENARLQPDLRQYQKKTIQWLLGRELTPATLDHFYTTLTTREGSVFYLSSITLDVMHTLPENIAIPSGGILADEMGLGKTVEMLALILLNPRIIETIGFTNEPPIKKMRLNEQETIKVLCVCTSTDRSLNEHRKSERRSTSADLKNIEKCCRCSTYQHKKCVRSYIDFPLYDGEYICPQCWELEGILVPSAATVIVSPNLIKLQWWSEINKHTNPPLRVILYEGASKKKLSPKELASYDVVLTDYSILRNEIHFTASNSSQITFRRERQRMRVNSPLLLVDWWRVCLDEAQMESSNTNASKLVKQLPAVHRWAVTGTPVQRSLDDLMTLVNFIGLDELSTNVFWHQLSLEFNRGRSENMIKILQKIMWRTCKSNVLDDLGIPPQSEVIHFVEFNNLEKLFYSDEHIDCLSAFYTKIEGFSDLKRVTPKTLKLILEPMLKLRQDCSLPVIRLKSEHNVVKKFLQPKELLDHMKSTNEIECKSQLRSMVSLYNGIAALYFLQKKYEESIKYYELVIKLSRENTGIISVDSLLQIHALHNVIQAYRTLHTIDASIIPEYETDCNKLEWKFLETYAITLQAAHKAYTSTVNESHETLLSESSEFWAQLLMVFQEIDLDEQLVSKVNSEVFLLFSSSVYERFRSTESILLVIDTWYNKINKVRADISEKFCELKYFIENVRPRKEINIAIWRKMNAFIRSVYDCHLSHIRNQTESSNKPNERDTNEPKKLCELCVVEKLLQKYECFVFDKALDAQTNNAEGTWNPTMQETILRTISSFARGKPALTEFVQHCRLHLEAIGQMKTEYKELLKLWIELEYIVKAYDELDMCKMRISLATLEEEKTSYNVYDYEIDDVLAESKFNFDAAQKEFVLKKARLKYIEHLEQKTDPGPCPICHTDEQNKYVVLECGHHLCFFCLKTLIEMKKLKLCCAICRHEQKFQNVYFVTRKITSEDGFDFQGDYSTKIQEIVLQVMKLKKEDENVKIIIFSQWAPILKCISQALEENLIEFRLKWSSKSIEEFKNDSLGITCLLMMLRHGSHGLNLIEATHVFLVEPLLNPGEELQALGRVHRIGQTKPTTVHRFIVKSTIEENIYNSFSKDKTHKWGDLTIETMKKLFERHSNDE